MITAEDFKAEVISLAQGMKVRPREIHVKPLKTKWASCSRKGRLTFDAALLEQSDEFRKEVIVHELLHLTVPNHGKLFKILHSSYLNHENRNETRSDEVSRDSHEVFEDTQSGRNASS
jgi:hypothetical protein